MKQREHNAGSEALEGSVLLISDKSGNQLTALLQRAGLTAAEAPNGIDALVNAIQGIRRGFTYDLVLVNLKEPFSEWQRTVMSIRNLSEYRSVPILICAERASAEAHEVFLPTGANEAITLPVDTVAKVNRLRYWLGPGKSLAAKAIEGLQLDEVQMLEGIELQTGLSHLAGNWKLYRDLLLKFSGGYSGFADQLEQKLEARELSDAGRMIHTLKGLSGSLGMMRLRLFSQQLEEIIRHGVMGEPRALVQPLSNELQKVLASIHENLSGSNPERTPQTEGMSITKLLELERTLNEHNPEATQRVKEIGSIKGCEPELARLKRAVAAYEFDTALAVLREIKASPLGSSAHRDD